MAEPLTLLRQPQTVTVELRGADGAAARRRVTVRALRRDARGPVIEALCSETGQPRSFCTSTLAAIHHDAGTAEAPEAFVARLSAELEGAPPPSDWLWIDRLVMLAISVTVVAVTLRVQGPKDLGLYAQVWSVLLFLAGALAGWALLKSLLGLPRRARWPRGRA